MLTVQSEGKRLRSRSDGPPPTLISREQLRGRNLSSFLTYQIFRRSCVTWSGSWTWTPFDTPFWNLGDSLIKGKIQPSPSTRSGVYMLPYRDCTAAYIGETGRSFEKRIKNLISAHDNNMFQLRKFGSKTWLVYYLNKNLSFLLENITLAAPPLNFSRLIQLSHKIRAIISGHNVSHKKIS